MIRIELAAASFNLQENQATQKKPLVYFCKQSKSSVSTVIKFQECKPYYTNKYIHAQVCIQKEIDTSYM